MLHWTSSSAGRPAPIAARPLTASIRASLVGLAVLLAVGCGETTRLTDTVFPPRPDDHPIEVFTVRPDRPFIEVAMVSEQSEFTSNREKLLTALKKRARAVGADAIVLSGFGQHTTAGPTTSSTNAVTGVTTFNTSNSTVHTAEGLAIRWKE